MKFQQEADQYLDDITLPEGWRIEARILRMYRWRSTWSIRLFRGDTLVRYGAFNQVEPAVRSMVATAERVGRAQVITADMDGWVKSWDEAS